MRSISSSVRAASLTRSLRVTTGAERAIAMTLQQRSIRQAREQDSVVMRHGGFPCDRPTR
ncbi:hypothetical protein AO398_12820 [Methylobacterium sp. GXS13]|nr:hypothetical protein AO398_12820 [Methylobacterium sp. GXS13]